MVVKWSRGYGFGTHCWYWVPMCLSTHSDPPTSPLRGNTTRGCSRGTGHYATEEINWCGTYLVHMAKAIK
ncbi:hypothetical protein PBY51_017384 [Eleginops maclovinus]|uniref:Uncharacterized protein n=1 Tax=Eleginops maclovinus TaxID=56733 RepID=A0AAN7XEU5_ELEMC|nr:hypothetical protein PBY51_017384 [Eleginops maclovinus]